MCPCEPTTADEGPALSRLASSCIGDTACLMPSLRLDGHKRWRLEILRFKCENIISAWIRLGKGSRCVQRCRCEIVDFNGFVTTCGMTHGITCNYQKKTYDIQITFYLIYCERRCRSHIYNSHDNAASHTGYVTIYFINNSFSLSLSLCLSHTSAMHIYFYHHNYIYHTFKGAKAQADSRMLSLELPSQDQVQSDSH